jgi:hypothetical protein
MTTASLIATKMALRKAAGLQVSYDAENGGRSIRTFADPKTRDAYMARWLEQGLNPRIETAAGQA